MPTAIMLNIKTHDKQPFDLAAAVAQKPATVLIVFRGPWCPFCQEYWEDIADYGADFQAAGAQVFGLSANRPKALRRFRRQHNLEYTMLSDPKLTSRKVLGLKKDSLHPAALSYKKGAFLQPGVFIWTQDGKLHYSWVQDPDLDNLYGATDRPKPKKLLKRIHEALNPTEAPEQPAGTPTVESRPSA